MWLITRVGFFSIVQKPGDQFTDTLTVRSRVFGDLVALQQHYLPGLGPIQESTDTDYRFRAVARRIDVAAAMARIIDDLNYINFKSEVAKQQGSKRASLYHKVWDVLHKLQTGPTAASTDGKQVIVKLAAEGGSLTLYGIQSPDGWQFRVETDEVGLIEDEDMSDLPQRPWVETWRSALKQLDAYPWTQLHAVTVHPKFRNRVFKALQTRKNKGLEIDWAQWGEALHILVDEE